MTDAVATMVRPRRKQEERRGEAEQRMLDAATALIAEKGFGRLILSEVGARAGYSVTLPIHYFKTKEALIGAVTRRIRDHYEAYLLARLEGAHGLAAVLTFIRTFTGHALEHTVMRRAWFMIITESATSTQLHGEVEGVRQSALADLSRFIRQAQAAGDIRSDDDADEQAMLIHGSLRGLLSLFFVAPEAVDLRRLTTLLEKSVCRSLRP